MKRILLLMALMSFTFMNAQISSVDFEDGTAGTWNIVSTNVETFTIFDTTTSGSTKDIHCAYAADLSQQDERLVSPAMDFTAVSSAINVYFKFNMSYYWSVTPNDNYDANLLVSTDGGTSWTNIWDETVQGTFVNFTWYDVTVDLSAYMGQADVRLAFQYLGADGASLDFDDIIVSETNHMISAPNPVTLLLPADAAIDVVIDTADGDSDGNPDMGVAFDWDPAIAGDAATNYGVYLGDAANNLTLLGNLTNDSVTITGMEYSTTYFWSIVAKNSGGEAVGSPVWSFTTQADPSASINEEILASSVSIYPTATTESFTINNTSDIALTSISLFDINGRIVLTSNLDNLIGERTINISNLSSGLYFVELNSADAKLTKKIIKK